VFTFRCCVVVVLFSFSLKAITLAFVSNVWVPEHDPTIEDTHRKQIEVDGKHLVLDILDTAGQEEYESVPVVLLFVLLLLGFFFFFAHHHMNRLLCFVFTGHFSSAVDARPVVSIWIWLHVGIQRGEQEEPERRETVVSENFDLQRGGPSPFGFGKFAFGVKRSP
jgi:Ras family